MVYHILLLIFVGFITTYYTIPRIIKVVEHKKLMDKPNVRSSHTKVTPTLGGIAFYLSLVLIVYLINFFTVFSVSIHFVTGLTILFLVGLKDDLVVLSPLPKLLAQILAVFMLIHNTGLLPTSLNGFLGFTYVSPLVGYPLSVLIMIIIINAYNLIDGIDGLAAFIGLVIITTYGVLFCYLEEPFYYLLCSGIIGMLIAFLRFNLSDNKKIFMGDTGSLILGFCISFLTFKFLSISKSNLSVLPLSLENFPLILTSILIVPLFDTARVFTIRLINKQSPFSPDRNHLHHILVDFGFSHKISSVIIAIFNLLFIAVFIALTSTVENFKALLILILLLIIPLYVLYRMNFSFSSIRKKIKFRRKLEEILSFFDKK